MHVDSSDQGAGGITHHTHHTHHAHHHTSRRELSYEEAQHSKGLTWMTALSRSLKSSLHAGLSIVVYRLVHVISLGDNISSLHLLIGAWRHM